MTQEFTDLGLFDILFVKMAIQSEVPSLRAYRYAGDSRDFVVAVTVAVDRGLASGCPRLAHIRDQQEPRFVDEDYMGTQPRSVFFIRGQSRRFQRSIASSSRSMARRSGFWWVQPNSRINRPMWSLWYRTPNFALMSSAIRCVVHKSVRYPWAIGPLRRYRTRRSFCFALSLGGLPGTGFGFKASSPPSAKASRHRMTLLALHPTHRATSLSERFSLRSSMARRRRSSNVAGEPLGRMGSILFPRCSSILHYLCRCQ